MAAADSLFFANFIGQEYAPLVFFFIFLGLTALIVVLGVEKGIEKVSKYLMPVLILLAIVICIYIMFIPGAGAGIKYYLLPDFSKFRLRQSVRQGTDCLLNEPCDGNYDNIWFIYKR